MIAALLILASVQAADEPACGLTDAERAGYMVMSYDVFDQTHGEGWRPLGETGACHELAGELIADYLLYSHVPLDAYNVRVLRFHAGQMFAFAGQTARALAFFEGSYGEPYAPGERLDWNSYVDATIAFLQQDRPALETARGRLLEQTAFENGMIPNLNVADGFIACYGDDYRTAYSSDCMSDGRVH